MTIAILIVALMLVVAVNAVPQQSESQIESAGRTEWTTRLIDAPVADILKRAEVAKLLGLSEDTLRLLIREGEFPAGIPYGKQVVVWDWEDLTYYRLRMRVMARLNIAVLKDSPG
jgi:excisionase family DNA binding protein